VSLRARVVVDTRPLGIRPYRRLWASTIVTSVGSQLTVVAIPLQIYNLTGSSAYVGLAGAFGLVPLVVFGLWGGAVADAVDRRRMALVTNTGIALTSTVLWVQAVLGLDSVAVLLVLVGAQQALFGANAAARGAAVPRLVPAGLLPAANALTSTVFWLGAITGPLLAGALLPALGLPTLYLIDALGLCVAVWAVWRLPPLPPGDSVARRAGPRQVVEGFGYLARQRVLLMALLADFIAMLFGMPRALFPQVARQTFGGPAGGGFALGALYASLSAGAVLAGLGSGAFTRVRRHGVMVTASVCAWGLAIVGFGLSRRLWLAVAFLGLGGAALFVLAVFRGTILQAAANDEMRGRMQGVLAVVAAGGPWVADIVHGTVGAAVGTTLAISGGGGLTVAAMLGAALALPALWRYRAPAFRPDEPRRPEAARPSP
jgi:hypothetical protein